MNIAIARQLAWQLDNQNQWADGPKIRIQVGAQKIDIEAVWTAEQGTAVTLDTHDEVIPASLIDPVAAEMKFLAAFPPPEAAA